MSSTHRKRITLYHFLVERQRDQPGASGELTRVMAQLATVAKIISNYVRRAALEGLRGQTGEINVQGEAQQKLDRLGHEVFVEAFEYVGIVGALASEEMEEPVVLHSDKDREKYVVLIDPINLGNRSRWAQPARQFADALGGNTDWPWSSGPTPADPVFPSRARRLWTSWPMQHTSPPSWGRTSSR